MTPDYSGKAVTICHQTLDDPNHIGPKIRGIWRNVCPVDCGWHGADYFGHDGANGRRAEEAKDHRCLRAGADGEVPAP